jgi:hypothetical protein
MTLIAGTAVKKPITMGMGALSSRIPTAQPIARVHMANPRLRLVV